jgi:polysaccharide biosynthesis PFTS motif protein
MGKRFIVLDPYVRVGDIIEKSDLVISFPYTSTKRFAEFYGKKSRYYVPTKYSEFFRAYSGYSAETIYGNKELLNFINGQR